MILLIVTCINRKLFAIKKKQEYSHWTRNTQSFKKLHLTSPLRRWKVYKSFDLEFLFLIYIRT